MLPTGEIKRRARERLSGNWKDVALLSIIPVVIGMLFAGGVSETLDIFSMGSPTDAELSEFSFLFFIDIKEILVNIATILFTTSIAYTLLDLVRYNDYTIEPLSDAFRVIRKGYTIQVLAIAIITWVFTILWSFLFIIPGIIANFAYSQAYYIYKDAIENGENLSPIDYITESKELMRGNKGRLFILELSFVGWHILALFTFGLGYLFLSPYIQTSKAVFYEDLVESYDASGYEDAF